MLEISVIFKNGDTLKYNTKNRFRAQQFFNKMKKNKYIKDIKTGFIYDNKNKGG